MPSHRDTIFALSSGRPPAAIAVVRISGARAGAALEKMIGRVPAPRQASLARVRDPRSGEAIDEALALWFPAPRSETGEDMAELQLHGGRAVIAAVLEALGRIEGLRPAEAGEFTRRAFENGRLDLTAVEGLADLIGAETQAQRRQAYRQLKGLLGDRAENWRMRLIEALALVEAGIDFSDEADVPRNLIRPALDAARALHDEIAAVLAQAGHGERLRDGLVVAIAGPPNAGKSTLLNRIAKREAAIVSPYAGTTRDVIEVHLDLDGYPVTLLDTAGMRDSDDPVEQEGVRRAKERATTADLVLWVTEAGRPLAHCGADRPVAELAGATGEKARSMADQANGRGAQATLARSSAGRRAGSRPLAERTLGGAAARRGSAAKEDRPEVGFASPLAELSCTAPVWWIRNKADLLTEAKGAASGADRSSHPNRRVGQKPTPKAYSTASTGTETGKSPPSAEATQKADRSEYKFVNDFEFIISISALQGNGIDELLSGLKKYVRDYFASESGLLTRERHRHALEEGRAALARAIGEGARREEIVAEELRLASRALGRLTGKVDVEDILDAIFRDFCIGK